MNSLSIVIIGRNEESLIAQCLQSVLTAAEEVGGAEVVMVDSASTDRTVEIARSLNVPVLSLKPEWGMSASAGRYVGFHHTHGESVMFVDADTVIERDWFRAALPYFDQADVAGVMGYLKDFDEQGHELPYVGQRSTQVRDMPWLRGIGLYRRSAMHQAGTFNPYVTTEEEAELAFRLRRHGFRLLQVPHAMGSHLRGASARSFLRRNMHHYRLAPLGRTLRYALSAGVGPQFFFQRFRPTLEFVGTISTLLAGAAFFWLDHRLMAEVILGMDAAVFAAIAIKKRNPMGPLIYCAQHSQILYGLLTGFFTAEVKDPRDYPLDAIETRSPQYHTVECRG